MAVLEEAVKILTVRVKKAFDQSFHEAFEDSLDYQGPLRLGVSRFKVECG